MAFDEPGVADANKSRLFPQIGDAGCAGQPHASTEATYHLKDIDGIYFFVLEKVENPTFQ